MFSHDRSSRLGTRVNTSSRTFSHAGVAICEVELVFGGILFSRPLRNSSYSNHVYTLSRLSSFSFSFSLLASAFLATSFSSALALSSTFSLASLALALRARGLGVAWMQRLLARISRRQTDKRASRVPAPVFWDRLASVRVLVEAVTAYTPMIGVVKRLHLSRLESTCVRFPLLASHGLDSSCECLHSGFFSVLKFIFIDRFFIFVLGGLIDSRLLESIVSVHQKSRSIIEDRLSSLPISVNPVLKIHCVVISSPLVNRVSPRVIVISITTVNKINLISVLGIGIITISVLSPGSVRTPAFRLFLFSVYLIGFILYKVCRTRWHSLSI